MMNKKEQKISILKSLYGSIESLNYRYGAEEKSIIRRILNEENWHLLNDDEKQARRKESILLGEKWSADDNDKVDYTYDKSVIVVYDAIRQILDRIDTLQDLPNTDLLRVKVFFLIEKDFIDESFKANRHLPIEVFQNLAETLAEDYPALQLKSFNSIYSVMFEKWPNKPK